MYDVYRSCTLPIMIRCVKTSNMELQIQSVRIGNYPKEGKVSQMILAIGPPHDLDRQMMGPLR